MNTNDQAVRRIAMTMLPMIAGLATVQLNALGDSLLAWWFVPEEMSLTSTTTEKVGPAILSYAQRLYQFPLGIFATALATAIFPALSRSAAEKNLPALSRTLARGIRVASFEGIPCVIGLIAVREPLIQTIFEHGEFRKWPQAVDRVSMSLLMYALGIWAFGVNQLIVRAFYAVQDAKTPLWISVRIVGLNLILNLILVNTVLKEAGLALATSVTAILQVLILLVRFDRQYVRIPWHETIVSITKCLIAALLMGGCVYLCDRQAAGYAPVTRLAILVAAGAASYLAAAFLLRCEELREMFQR